MQKGSSMKIVITGGPGGGKTTALDLFRRELYEKVVVIPESATAIFQGGIQRDSREPVLKAIQKTIYYHQKNVELIYKEQNGSKTLLCDRGTLDGLAYWPSSEENFFETIKSSFREEIDKYDAVIFFETAAKSGNDISSNNPYRQETSEEAIKLDNRLQSIWERHPNFHLVKSRGSFIEKIMNGIEVIKKVVK